MLPSNNFWGALADRVLAHRGLTLVLCLALTLLAGMGLSQLKFSTDYRIFFSADNPDLAALEKLELNFGRAETVFMALSPANGEVFTQDTLEAIRYLSQQYGRVPYAKGAASLSTYYDVRGEADGISAAPLLPEGPLEDVDRQALKQRALNEPRLTNGLLSVKGDVAGVVYFFDLPHQKPELESEQVADAVRAIAAEAEAAHPGLKIRMTGVILLNEAMRELVEQDFLRLNPLAYGLMFGLLAIFFMHLRAALGTLIVALMGIITSFGMAGWLGITMTPASMSASIIILTLAIADSVHILTTAASLGAQGQDARAALRGSMLSNGQPILMTTLTTAVGALGMNGSDSPPYQHLGNMVALGVVAAWFFSATFLVAWTGYFPLTRKALDGRETRLLSWMAEFVIRRRNALLIGAAVFTLVTLAAVPQNRFGDNYVEFFQPQVKFRQDAEYINAHIVGAQYVDYGVYAAEPEAIYEPQFLRHIEAFTQWLAAQPGVTKVSSVLDVLKRLNETMNDSDRSHYRLPDERELVAQYLLFYEMSLPSGQDLTHLVNLDKSAVRIAVQLNEMTSAQMQALDESARAWMREHWPPEMQTRGTGIGMMFANIAWRNFASMASGTLVAALLIVGLLWLSFRSLRLCLVSILPNVLPALYGFGIWGMTIGKVSMSLSVVISLTIGIVVDDTIHFLSHYGRARRAGKSPEDALRQAFASVGTALWLLSAILVGGFMVLTLSDFRLTAHLGLMTSLIIGISIFADFLLLSALLLWLERKKS